MNLEDFPSLDKDSYCGERVGANKQIEVIGFYRKRVKKLIKCYVLKCDICKEDPELFGDGYFLGFRSNLNKGILPCGCSLSPKWTKEQNTIRITRLCEEKGYIFHGYYEDYNGASTKLSMECSIHGKWNTTNIDVFTNKENSGCPYCGEERGAKSRSLTKKELESKFISTNKFSEGSLFCETDFEDASQTRMWRVYCTECGETGLGRRRSLIKGLRACACSTHQQTLAYILQIVDENKPLCIKYGITANWKRRVSHIRKVSDFNIMVFGVWIFPSVEQCKVAEKLCKKTLNKFYIDKEKLKDGFTELTYVDNIDTVIQIYEENGGIKIDF